MICDSFVRCQTTTPTYARCRQYQSLDNDAKISWQYRRLKGWLKPLVEIEAPAKTIFKQDDSFTQQFTQAKQQVMDWVRWSQDHLHDLMDMFAPMFETYNVTDDLKEVRGYLVYGRRKEVEVNRRRKERWQSVGLSSDKRVIVMTYDRLETENNKDLIVCTYEKRMLYAKGSVI